MAAQDSNLEPSHAVVTQEACPRFTVEEDGGEGGIRLLPGTTKPPTMTIEGFLFWLGNRDSNPNYLIQNQAFYL
jgi:hypothetical protein